MGAYIKYSTAISPQESFEQPFPWNETKLYTDRLECVEPVYKNYFPPMKIRRMSRLVKMALTSAKVCLDKAGVEIPGAIITASGWGCLSDTYKYLDEIKDKNVSLPSPATFIQSTHNTPGGQIALTLGCENYNNVIVNGNTSFELALTDALMLTSEAHDNILVGGFDELSEVDYELKKGASYWKEEGVTSISFIDHDSEGTLAGEGAAFLLISKDSEGCSAELKVCTILNCLPDVDYLKKELENLLKEVNLKIEDIDLVLSGANGNNRTMPLYQELEDSVFYTSSILRFKQYCGEYDTATSFATWLANSIIQSQKLPNSFAIKAKYKTIKNILIYNYAGENKHAITLVSKTCI